MSRIIQDRIAALEAGLTNTIGATSGDFSLLNYGGSFQLAMQAALETQSRIVILPGTYTLDAPIVITNNNVEIVGYGDPTLVINHSGAVGAFDALINTGLVIDGITFQVDNWVASQRIIEIDPVGLQTLNCKIRNNTFIFGLGVEDDFAPTFSAGNEMIGVNVTQGVGCKVQDNVFYPNKGVTGIRMASGQRNVVERNEFNNASVFYLPIIQDAQRRPCYIGVDSQAETATVIRGNIFINLGLIDASPPRVDRRLTHALRVQIPNIDKGVVEYGHAVLQDNVFMDCLTYDTCVVDLRGARWLMMSGGYFCFNGTGAASGSGFLRIADASGDRTGTNAYSYQSQIVGVHFHNPGTTGAACIYMHSASDIAIQGCTFHELYCNAPIVFDPGAGAANLKSISIQGCKASWPSGSPNTRFFSKRIGTTANAAKDLFIGNTVCSTGDSAELIDGMYDGTVFAGKHCVKGIVVDSTGVETASDIGTNNRFFGQ